MIKLQKGLESVSVELEESLSSNPVWYFCENGYQSTGVNITPKQFHMLRELIAKPEIVEFYEKD